MSGKLIGGPSCWVSPTAGDLSARQPTCPAFLEIGTTLRVVVGTFQRPNHPPRDMQPRESVLFRGHRGAAAWPAFARPVKGFAPAPLALDAHP